MAILRTIVVAVAVLCVPLAASALSCDEHFDGADGTLPLLLVSTGDPDDTGALTIQSGMLAHTEAGSAHLVWLCESWFPPGGAYFKVLGAGWEFAWRISTHSVSTGTCLRLSHDDRHGAWAYSVSQVSWECPDPSSCPDCQYMWHAGTEEWTVSYPTGVPVEEWQTVRVTESEGLTPVVRVTIDDVLIFEQTFGIAPEPCLSGLGCSGGEAGAVAFDYVIVEWPDPVEASTWGSVKALYR
jgi:hypothetical protein